MNPTIGRVAPWHQTNWDWRAAGNFLCGGAGTGLLLFAAAFGYLGGDYRLCAALGLALVAAGLGCVWLEIGRPLRALNVFRQPQRSWMTREALIAPWLFAFGLAALWQGGGSLAWLVALLAAVFLYCQARMIAASKGIPAWRLPQTVPLVVATGLTEGGSLLVLIAAQTLHSSLRWLEAALVVLVLARAIAWRRYRTQLERTGAPARAVAVLEKLDVPFGIFGIWGAGLLLLFAIAGNSVWLGSLAAVIAFAAGWLFKFVLITRAAYNQGFSLPHTPVRGAGRPGPGAKPGWV